MRDVDGVCREIHQLHAIEGLSDAGYLADDSDGEGYAGLSGIACSVPTVASHASVNTHPSSQPSSNTSLHVTAPRRHLFQRPPDFQPLVDTTADVAAAQHSAKLAESARRAARQTTQNAFVEDLCHVVATGAPEGKLGMAPVATITKQGKVTCVESYSTLASVRSNKDIHVMHEQHAEGQEKRARMANRDSFVQSVASELAPGVLQKSKLN